MKKSYILSISFCYHDSSITFSNKNEILLHLELERISRKKHDRFKDLKQVDNIVSLGLSELNITIDDIGKVLVTRWNNLYGDENVTILGRKFKAILTGHHENHIGTSFPSHFKKCVILCSDGGSENGYAKLYYKNGNKIWLVEDLDNEVFTGKFYGTVAQMIIEPKGSQAHMSGVGKLMGLSSYGKFNRKIVNLIENNLEELNSLHFQDVNNLLKKFNLQPNYEQVWKDKYKKDIAYNAHYYWVDKCANYLKKHNKFSKNICLVGGCALNITLNSKLIDEKIFDNVYVSPISTDSGQSLGAILYHYPNIKCNYPYLGRGFESNVIYDKNEIIEDLLSNKIIAWYQGRSEIGARALGHRSFIGIPNSVEMRKKISEEIKGREPYRPVAAIIPRIFVNKYFYQNYDSPYMTFCVSAKDITKKLAPAIVHYDGTTRVQTLEKNDNPILYDIMLELEKKGLPPILMNTSFNVMGDPIVDTQLDAIQTFIKSKADALYINGTKYFTQKLVSLIIPTYNNDKKLEMILQSLDQVEILHDNNIEVLIIQNHHSKSKYYKTKKFEKKFNVKVFHEPNQGKSCALNYGIKKANGKYIASTDDDIIVTDKKWLYSFVKEFEKNPKLGYCSGKVSMYRETSNKYSNIWENKGGLSKGEVVKYWSRRYLESFKHKLVPWKLHKMCAGANQMIPKKVLLEIGGYSEFLGKKGNVDGLTLEIGYKIAKKGYELMYNPNIEVFHQHPRSEEDIKKKLYYYGMQDTGVSMYIYLENNDFRYLWWALVGHEMYTIKKMVKRIFKKYNLPISYIWCGFKGNLAGWKLCLKNYNKMKRGKRG